MRNAYHADQTVEVQIKQIKKESYRICRRNADQSEQTFIIFLRHHDRKVIYLIDLLKPLAGLTGVDLWKSLPDVAAIAAARSWFALSKEERAAYIDEATRLSLASGARHARQEVAKNQNYVRSVYCEEYVKVYRKLYPTDPCLSDIAGKHGLQLWYALPDHIALPSEEYLGWNINVFVCAVQIAYPHWRLMTCTSVDERRNRSDGDLMGTYIKKMESLGVHECIARARKLRNGDLMEAYKNQLEKVANAEQEMAEAAKDRSSAFVIFWFITEQEDHQNDKKVFSQKVFINSFRSLYLSLPLPL